MSEFKRLNDDGRRKANEESDNGNVSVDICTVHISLQKGKKVQSDSQHQNLRDLVRSCEEENQEPWLSWRRCFGK